MLAPQNAASPITNPNDPALNPKPTPVAQTPKPEVKPTPVTPKPEVKPTPVAPKPPDQILDEATKLFQADLKSAGIADLTTSGDSAYYAAIKSGLILLPATFWSFSPLFNFTSGDSRYDLFSLEKQLQSAHKTYQECLDAKKTGRFIGIYGDDIESAGKKVETLRAQLIKANAEFNGLYDQCRGIAEEAKRAIAAKEVEIKNLNAEAAKIGRDPSRGGELDKMYSRINDAEKEIKGEREKVASFESMKAVFKR